MRASISQIENIPEHTPTLEENRSLRDIHRRHPKVFDLNDAQTLKVRFNKNNSSKTIQLFLF